MAILYRLEVFDHKSFCVCFSPGAKKSDGFWVVEHLNVFFIILMPIRHLIHCVKSTRLNHQYWFRRSTCRSVQEKREGMEENMDNALKGTEVLYFAHVPRNPTATVPIATKMCI